MKKKAKLILICLLPLLMLTGCTSANLAQQREKYAGEGEQIIVGVPVPLEFARSNTGFLNGLELALMDVNARGVNGKTVRLEIVDDHGIFKNAVDIAQEFSENIHMMAVIGHWYSDICIPVSSIYEDAGMLVVAPTVSNPELMQKKRRYIFQNIPSDKKIAQQMCLYAKNQGYAKMAIYYEEGSYGRNLAGAFEKEAKLNGLEIIDRSADLIDDVDFKKVHDKWQALDFDAVFLAVNTEEGIHFIKKFRQINKATPILSGDGLDVDNLVETIGVDGKDLVVATIYNPFCDEAILKDFNRRYSDQFHEKPDVWAIQGYDSLQLIVSAMENTGSCSPAVLADYLRDMDSMQLVSGDIHFNQWGEIEGREVYKKKVVDNQFQFIN